ncbi:MAG: AfsR/SARP family transcriptional regulator, partial [Nocardioidaceae bacterium]
LMLDAEVAGWPWLSRIGRALLETATRPTAAPAAEPSADRDPWGRALVTFIDGVSRHVPASLREAASLFQELGAAVPAQWAVCLAEAAAAHAMPGTAATSAPARGPGEAGQRARALGLRDALTVIDAWAGTGRPAAPAAPVAPVTPAAPVVPATPAAPVGPVGPVAASPATPDARGSSASVTGPTASAVPPVELRLLGGMDIAICGVPVDLSRVRPRARSTLRWLALRAGDVVHRDALAAGLWPDVDQEGSLHSLQVAISSLRSLLHSAAADPTGRARTGRSSLLVRVGESYGLSLPPGGRSDVLEFEARLAEARSARLEGERAAQRAELSSALELYRGDLLPEEGAAEWVVADRERLRLAAAGAAEALARCLGEAGELGDAIEAVRSCLRLDPYRDGAWRLLVRLHSRAGNLAAPGAARREHGQILAELGLPAEV